MSGNVNFDHPPAGGGPPFTLTLYPDSLAFGSIGYADMSAPMRSQVSSKRLSDLTASEAKAGSEIKAAAGWEVKIELASAQNGELRMTQAANGSRSTKVSSDAQDDVDRVGGIAAIWDELDRRTL